MKLFKSFADFVNESLVTEASDKFKIKANTPNSNTGEIAVFKFVLREFEPQASLPQLAVGSALVRPEFKKFADDASLIAFIKIVKARDTGSLTPRELLKGAIIFKKAEGFDKTKAAPLVKVGNFEVYDANSAAQMKAGDNTAIDIEADMQEIDTDNQLLPLKPEETQSANLEYSEVETIQPDADVLAFLKSKLLNGDLVKFNKSGNRISEIKGTQALISKFKRADKKTLSTASSQITKSGIDGIYGLGTAAALGLLTKDGKPKDSISADTVMDMAKWCKLNEMTKADVEKIFNDNVIKAAGQPANQATPTDSKYYFVNKGWTYSDDANPYKN